MIKINNKTYNLGVNNYLKRHHSKHKIVIGGTFSENMNHFSGWKTRHGGNFKRISAYTIDIYGNIYQHYPPEFYSKYLDIAGIDEHIITISIENEGWLTKDIDDSRYINYIGNIYNRKDVIVEKRWRDQIFWAPYTKEQLSSTVKLCKYLCGTFGIPKQAVGHNTKFDGIREFKGVVYKSNFHKHFSDLSPAWDYTTFKQQLEIN